MRWVAEGPRDTATWAASAPTVQRRNFCRGTARIHQQKDGNIHRPLKIRTDSVHARVRELGSIDFSTPQPVLYGITLVWNNIRLWNLMELLEKWILYEMQITGSWWRHYPIQNIILKSEIWWKTQYFDKNDCFHHLSEQISTFIHRILRGLWTMVTSHNQHATGWRPGSQLPVYDEIIQQRSTM